VILDNGIGVNKGIKIESEKAMTVIKTVLEASEDRGPLNKEESI
jgi:hypothetical protein